MQNNNKRQGVTQFLADKCATLRAGQFELAQQILAGRPSIADHPDFIRSVIRMQEQLPSCEWLLTALTELSEDEQAWTPAIKVEMAKLQERIGVHLAVIRGRPGTLVANLANESVSVLLELHACLDNFVEDQASWFVETAVAAA